jgi:hypothetical protein
MLLNRNAALKRAGYERAGANIAALPDMSVLSAGRRAAPVMPRELFGDAWPLLNDLADGAGAPVDYVGVSFLAVCASLIGGKRRVKPYDTSDWCEPAILWCALVGDPSAAKSPAIDAVTKPLRDIERDCADDHAANLMAWEAQTERANAERAQWKDDVRAAAKEKLGTPMLPNSAVLPSMPERRRLLVMDATPEALGSILAGNPAGTLSLRDELSAFLTTFDRYSPGGRPFWLEAYGGRSYVVDRKGRDGPIQLDFLGVSMLGGIQPAKLAETLFDAADDGLSARFIWAWPESIPYEPPRKLADMDALANVYRRLNDLDWAATEDGRRVPVILPLAPEARDIFVQWVRESSEGMEDHSALYQGLVGKMRGGVLRLALVSELFAWAWGGGEEPRAVSATTLAKAIEFVEDYVKPAALRVFGDVALPPVERNAAVLARYVRKLKLRTINAREMRRSPHKQHLAGMREAGPLNDALEYLVEHGWLFETPSRDGAPGQPRRDYTVNPAVHGGG